MTKQDEAEEAMRQLASTDEEHGRLKGHAKALEDRLKHVLSVESLKHTGSEASKKTVALASEVYKKALDEYEDAQIAYLMLENKRESWERTWEHFRTLSSNKRSGVVI